MKFSLILPTYRVAKYITACLESCCNQSGVSPRNYEIIIVNDETPDNSIEVAQKVINRYPSHNWKIVNRKNGGLSAARNSGLTVASGDYIWFIDSDDFIEANALYILSTIIDKGDFDIINFTHKTIYKDNHFVGGTHHFDGHPISGVEYLASTSFLSAWTCIYKREFLINNGLRFKEGVIWEDSEFNTRAYLLTHKCYCISNALYNYIRREDSISDFRATPFSTNSRISNAFGLDKYFRTMNYSARELKAAYSSIASMLIAAIAGLPELSKEARKQFRHEIRSHRQQFFHIARKCPKLKNKIILLCFLVAPALCENILNAKIHQIITKSANTQAR